MILKALTLENIRSYKDETKIEFPTGTTMFEGDIASGKSTLLYAIEFALFGLGSIKGSFILRNGVKQGWVSLLFGVDSKEYEVHRVLVRKGKSVQQGECYISGPSGKMLLSPTEVKEKILQIIGFNEPPNPKAQSVIYRYAIFTPQDEMKEVILKDSDERLQTLRRAFRIEDYKVAVDNSGLIVSRVKERMAHFEGATKDLSETKLILSETQQKIQRLTEELTPLKQKESEVKARHQARNDELEKLKALREKIGKAEERLSQLKGRIAEAEESLDGFVEDNDELHRTIDGTLQPKILQFQVVNKPTEKTKSELKQELESLRKKLTETQKLKAKVEERKGNFNSILQNKSCPVCERPVDSQDFKDKIRHLEKEESQLEKSIQRVEKDIDGINVIVEELQKYKEAQNQLLILRTQLKNTKARITKNENAIEELKGKISDLNEQLKATENEIKPLQKVLTRIQDLTKEVDNLQTELTNVGKEVASKDQSIRDLKENEKQYSEQLALKERQLIIRDSLNEHKLWLTDYFTPTVENIEKHVMTSLNQKFNQQFQKWFHILIDDPDLQVRVNEDFSPVIEREGYEQDYATLCGGEKTSVALAYRLALNTTVQEVAIEGGANLLILDEPTDGFSKEQLFKVRDILAELKCPQVILVSHDKELEGFADYVYKVERRDGVSRIIA